MMDAEDGVGGEGMAFVVQTQGKQALGNAGNGKGYEGITPCLALEIDTNPDMGQETTVRLKKNGPQNVLLEGITDIEYLEDLKIRTLLVEYYADTKDLMVQLNDQVVLEGYIDMAEELSTHSATWGFTAANGDHFTSDQWVYFRRFNNGPTDVGPELAPHTAPEPAPGPDLVLLKEDFNQHVPNFVFHDNVFGEGADPAFILGEISPDRYGSWHDGHSTGGLRLTLTAPDAAGSLSGGFDTDLVLTEDIQSAKLEFKYIADLKYGFTSMDNGQIFAGVDDALQVIDTYRGGMDASQPLWGRCQVDLGNISAGSHKIMIGAILSTQDATGGGIFFQIRFDNLSVTGSTAQA